MKKRVLSLALALIFCTSLFSIAAMATQEDNEEQTVPLEEVLPESGGGETPGETPGEAATMLPEPNDAGVITLVENVTATLTVNEGETRTLDLAGFTLTNPEGAHTIVNRGVLTIRDTGEGKTGTVLNNAAGKSALQNEPGGTVVIDGGTLKKDLNSGNNDYYVITNHGALITINGGAIESASTHSSAIENGWYTPSQNESGAYSQLVINSGTVSNTGGGVCATGGLYTLKNDDYGKMTIRGGTFTNTTSNAGTVLNWNELTIENGTFDAANAAVATMCEGETEPTYAYEQGKTTITGGTFKGFLGSNTEYSKAISVAVSGGAFSDMSFVPYAAENANVKLSDDVTLTEPVEITKSLTLDLDGHSVTGTDTRVFHVKSGTLTLKNTGSAETGKVESTHTENSETFSASSSVIRVGDGADAGESKAAAGLVIDTGVTVSTDWCYGVSVFGGATDETVTVRGTIAVTGGASALSGNGLAQYRNTAIHIESGAKLSATGSAAIYHPQAGTLNVKGGEITGLIGIAARAGTVSVTGGDITANGSEAIAVGDAQQLLAPAAIALDAASNYPGLAGAKVTVSGGKLTGGGTDKLALKYYPAGEETAPISVTGGTFSSDPSKVPVSEETTVSYVASNHRVTKGGTEEAPTWAVSRVSSGGGGSYTPPTTTTTQENEDGSTTTTVTNNRTGTVTETTKAPDGSSTVVETKKDGTVTTTVTTADGSTATTVAKPDGSSQTDIRQADGTAATITTDTEGNTLTQVELSDKAVTAAQDSGEAVVLPIPAVEAAQDAETAPTVEVVVPKGSGEVNVEIPVTEVTPGTVAVIVHADGTEEIVKTSVPTGAGVALTLEGSATVKIVDNTKPFDDLSDGHWAKDSVDFVTARELFQGTAAKTFDPDLSMTRGMLLTVLARLEDVEPADGESWYGGAVQWAMGKGITDGTNPQDPITREQLATMLYRYAGSPSTGGSLTRFADAGSVSDYAQAALKWAVEIGLINGKGDGALDPQGQATRAEVAAMLERFVRNG